PRWRRGRRHTVRSGRSASEMPPRRPSERPSPSAGFPRAGTPHGAPPRRGRRNPASGPTRVLSAWFISLANHSCRFQPRRLLSWVRCWFIIPLFCVIRLPMTRDTANWAGQLLANGRYDVRQKLGEGGMAHVYQALDTFLERDVVIKV